MSKNKALFAEQGREKVKKGIDLVANAVKSTLGASGRNVIIKTNENSYQITKDGVSVANSFGKLEDDVEDVGRLMVQEVAEKTRENAGDGTTTSSILLQSIITAGLDCLNSGCNVTQLKAGMDYATKLVVDKIKSISKVADSLDILKKIATISANGDEKIGSIVAEAVDNVGTDGIIEVIENKNSYDTGVVYSDGYNYKGGIGSLQFFHPTEQGIIELENPLIVCFSGKIESEKEITSIMRIGVENNRSILIVCDEIVYPALPSMIYNRQSYIASSGSQGCNSVWVRAVGSPDNRLKQLEDLAILTGGELISEQYKGNLLKNTEISSMGACEKVTIKESGTLFVGGGGSKELISKRKEEIKQYIETETNDYNLDLAKQRLAKLSGSIATIKVGGKTETEIKEKADRIDDAKRATMAAKEEGFITGGGTGLHNCRNIDLGIAEVIDDDFKKGCSIILSSLSSPIKQLLKNSDCENVDIGSLEDGYGFNSLTNKVENLLEKGIIDPTKVVRIALENASSIAGLFLTTEAVIF